MRLFLAVNLTPELRDEIAALSAPLRAAAPGLSWVATERVHLTLKFIGDVPPEAVPPLAAAMDQVASGHRPFSLDLRGFGAFPNFRRARVVWMGVEPAPRLELLQHDVEHRCASLGYELEGRPFRPHLTLARVRGATEERALRDLARMARTLDPHLESDVNSIDLMHSTLATSGSRYELLHAAPLGVAGAR